MIKAIIFDADGVIVHREKYFSERLEEDYGVLRTESLKFFNNEFAGCLVGKKDLKQVLPKYLKQWGWKKSLEELLTYWFEKEGKRDEELVNYIQKLRETGIKIYIGTNNEKYRTEYLRDKMELGEISHKVYGSGHIGYVKPDHNFFAHIINDQNLEKNEVLFWDDDEDNVKAAIEFGIHAEIYRSFKEFKTIIKKYL